MGVQFCWILVVASRITASRNVHRLPWIFLSSHLFCLFQSTRIHGECSSAKPTRSLAGRSLALQLGPKTTVGGHCDET
jgi:hypothetical protein